jgi:hypothetical protein
MTAKTALAPLSSQAKSLKTGTYEHYKGNQYRLIGIARHSESLEELVIYQDLSDPEKIWARPLALFCDQVELENGNFTPRFKKIE